MSSWLYELGGKDHHSRHIDEQWATWNEWRQKIHPLVENVYDCPSLPGAGSFVLLKNFNALRMMGMLHA